MRVLITRPHPESLAFATALASIGAQAVFLPTITIQALPDTSLLDQALMQLHTYHWLVLTSANAVEALLSRQAALGITRFPDSLRVAAVGPQTAARLLDAGVVPNFVPARYLAEAILPGLGELKNRRVLLPLADIAPDTLSHAIQQAQGIPHVVTAYHTLPALPDPCGLLALSVGVDVLTFTSGSTVRNFVILLQRAGLDPFHLPGAPLVACIGPQTAQTAQQLGFTVAIVASEQTSAGLAHAIATHFENNLSR
jgi:uroporphyrinogen III methyltransferase/synthase